MARITKTRKPQAAPRTAMELLMHEHLAALSVRGYSENTVHSRRVYLGFFVEWAYQHGLQAISGISFSIAKRTASR